MYIKHFLFIFFVAVAIVVVVVAVNPDVVGVVALRTHY